MFTHHNFPTSKFAPGRRMVLRGGQRGSSQEIEVIRELFIQQSPIHGPRSCGAIWGCTVPRAESESWHGQLKSGLDCRFNPANRSSWPSLSLRTFIICSRPLVTVSHLIDKKGLVRVGVDRSTWSSPIVSKANQPPFEYPSGLGGK